MRKLSPILALFVASCSLSRSAPDTTARPESAVAVTSTSAPAPEPAPPPPPPPPTTTTAPSDDARVRSDSPTGGSVAQEKDAEGDFSVFGGKLAAGAPLHRANIGRGAVALADPSVRNEIMELDAKAPATPMFAPDKSERKSPPRIAQGHSGADESKPDDGDDRGFVSTGVNPLVSAAVDNLSTFAVDVDTGSFSLSRRALESGAMPSPAGVRVEEWVNAFHYSYKDDADEHPFSIHVEGAPLAKNSYVMRIGIQGKRIQKQARDPVHLTFLVDVSGSMRPRDRLALAKQSLDLLVDELSEKDSVSLVTYAGKTGLVLASTPVTSSNKGLIKSAIDGLKAGGGTNMGSGMELAYREADKALGDKGISRVIVMTDGDTNIGHMSFKEIMKSIHGYVSEGVTLSTVGFGTGNYKDKLLEQLADAGDGNYSYIGSLKDAQKLFVDDLTGTLQVIAKDAKVQVEMNRDVVDSYRLIGYEDRDIADRDFRNDKVDAGEIGAGHTVTALYEVQFKTDEPSGNIATVRVRYKEPRGTKATETALAFPAKALVHSIEDMSVDGRFAVGVGLAAEVFRHSSHMDRLGIDLADAQKLLVSGATGPFASERRDFVRLLAPLAAGQSVAAR